jgi:peptide/nickel transport system substrate-binding protein
MQLIQNQLKDIEITLELELIDSAKDQEDKRTGNFVIGSTGGAAYIDPDLSYYKSFHTEKEPLKVSNHSRYSNPKMDGLLEQGRTEPDFQKRYRIYKEVTEILEDEVPQVSLGFAHEPFAFRSWVKGFRVHTNGAFFYGVGGMGMTWLER